MCEIKDCYLTEYGYWINKEYHLFQRNIFMTNFGSINYIKAIRNNIGIFKTAYCYDIENQNDAFLYGDFYLDFDSTDFNLVREDALKAISYLKIVFGIKEENCLLYFSGNKGMHITIPASVFGVQPSKNLNNVYKTIAKTLFDYIDNETIDLRIYDKKRMFRIPNSIHEVTNLHKINITMDELRNCTHDEIKKIAENKRCILTPDSDTITRAKNMFESFEQLTAENENKINNIKGAGTLKYLPPCIKNILENGAQKGMRNNVLAILASYYKATGKDLETALKELKEWSETKNNLALSYYELKRTITSIYEHDYQFGCSSIKDLGLCDKENECKFRR